MSNVKRRYDQNRHLIGQEELAYSGLRPPPASRLPSTLCIMKTYFIHLASVVFLIGWCTTAQATESVTVKNVSVHLFLTPSGEFSPDVTEVKNFQSWNFSPIMEGIPDGQRFYSYLIKVRLSTKAEAFLKNEIGVIEVRSKERKRILAKQKISDVYFPHKSEAVVGFFVQGNVCEPVLITAKTKTSTVTKEIIFACGE